MTNRTEERKQKRELEKKKKKFATYPNEELKLFELDEQEATTLELRNAQLTIPLINYRQAAGWHGVQANIAYEHIEMHRGNFYVAGGNTVATAAGATNYWAIYPGKPTHELHVLYEVHTEAEASIELRRNANIDGAGSSMNQANVNQTLDKTAVGVAREEVSIVGASGTVVDRFFHYGKRVSVLLRTTNEWIVAPGGNLVIGVTNDNAAEKKLSVRFSWYEEEVKGTYKR